MRNFLSICIVLAVVLTGCQILNPLPANPTPLPSTPTPLPPKEINICLGYEPESLYVYNAASKAAKSVMAAIYDGPVEMINGQPQPVIFERIPSITDGSARVLPIGVNPGDPVVNTAGNFVKLQTGVSVFPAGCTSPTCAIVFDGVSPLQMDQTTATFKIHSGIVWSDGQPLTARDSVFSFEIASDPTTPINRKYTDQTAEYVALDDDTIEWTSHPGLITNEFWNYFWTPLPEHSWKDLSPSELLESDAANRTPLGWGAFMVNEWIPGERIEMVKNPYYFLANQGIPKVDVLNFIFINSQDFENIGQLANGRCDIVSDTVLDVKTLGENKPEDFGFKSVTKESTRLVLIALGIKPASYDDNYNPYGVDRPDIFGDIRTRQAIAYCIDRDTIINQLLRGNASASTSILPSSHPYLTGTTLTKYTFDPAAAASMLESVGWFDLDQNPDTPLAHIGNTQIPYGTPLSVSLLVSESSLQNEIAAEIASSLNGCGIEVVIERIPANELYLPGPGGRLFGRNFDIALLSWDTGDDFACEMFMANEIPTNANDWLGKITGGSNFFGYSNNQFDIDCANFRNAGLDSGMKTNVSKSLVEIINDELPVIPLFHYLDTFLISDRICDSTEIYSGNEIYNSIEFIRLNMECH
ncbi:MAG: hypothetical protein FJZ98_00020 [Chloroflexi bacterium]|nr:hypothetical protein [Chloroflexota bacterium]